MTYEKKISAFIRDVTKVIPMPKSEATRRLDEILFHQKELLLEEKTKRKYNYPMGVSQWRNHGKKFGYWDFFIKEQKNYHELFCDIWKLGDEIIAMCDIKEHITDIYLASISDFTSNENETNKVIAKLQKKYKMGKRWSVDMYTPIALIALAILEHRCPC